MYQRSSRLFSGQPRRRCIKYSKKQKIAVNKTCVAKPAIIKSTPTGLSAKMAASEPPQPMKERHMKSPRINSVANQCGRICEKRATGYCRWRLLMPR